MKALLIALAALALAAVVFVIAQRSYMPAIDPFPDTTYLDSTSSINGSLSFKARVVSELGRGSGFTSVRFTAVETVSAQPLDLVVLLPDALERPLLLPGQVFQVMATADKGNLVADDLVKY